MDYWLVLVFIYSITLLLITNSEGKIFTIMRGKQIILRAVTIADFIASWFWSRARRWNSRIASYATVSATQLSAKIGRQKTASVAVRSITIAK